MNERIPADLGIDVNKAKKIVQDLAKERLSNSLVQAVALLRQRNLSGAVSKLDSRSHFSLFFLINISNFLCHLKLSDVKMILISISYPKV